MQAFRSKKGKGKGGSSKGVKKQISNQKWGGQNASMGKGSSGGVLGQFLGTITQIGQKFGFIECPDLTAIGQASDVFILATELKQYQEGHKVKFTAFLDSQGRVQGKDLKSGLKGVQNNSSTRKGPFWSFQMAGASNAIVEKDTSGGVLGQFLGTITAIGPKFGFIECPDLEDQGQATEAFILADELRQYKEGHTVKFTAYLDGQGRLQGKDLKSGLKGAQNDHEKDTSGGVLGQFLGTITKVGPKFGFIECPDLEDEGQATEAFILADELKQYKEGHKVKFTAYLDGQGRLQGKDLKSGLR